MAAFKTTPWRLISGTLGVICLVLTATLGIMLKYTFTNQSIQPTSSPGHSLELQEGSGCSSCPPKWIGYECNCYLISNESKPWAESKAICASQNSSLLHLKNRDELHFMKNNGNFYWIGNSYSEEHGSWLWETGSAISQDLFSFNRKVNPSKCLVYSPTKDFLDEPCTKENYYICKQPLI